jgi:hypothetical protein
MAVADRHDRQDNRVNRNGAYWFALGMLVGAVLFTVACYGYIVLTLRGW